MGGRGRGSCGVGKGAEGVGGKLWVGRYRAVVYDGDGCVDLNVPMMFCRLLGIQESVRSGREVFDGCDVALH